MLLHEFHGLLQLVWSVEREQLYALEVALGDPGQRARRWHLHEAGDAEIGHRRHAQVPAHRRRHLADQPPEHFPAIVHDLPIGVRQQAGPRVVGGDGPRELPRDARQPAACARYGTPRRR